MEETEPMNPHIQVDAAQREAEIAELERLRASCNNLSRACGFPIVENREQMLGVVEKLVDRLRAENAELRAVVDRVKNLVTQHAKAVRRIGRILF